MVPSFGSLRACTGARVVSAVFVVIGVVVDQATGDIVMADGG